MEGKHAMNKTDREWVIDLVDRVTELQLEVAQLRAEVDRLKLGMLTLQLDQASRDTLIALLNPKPDGE
jgi:hypothetical protein